MVQEHKNTTKLIAIYRKLQIFAGYNTSSLMEKIGIFCSASNRLPSVYVEITRQLGEWLGKEKKTIIYGGANLGLMEDIASAAKANGATLIGVVPKILEKNGKVSTLLDRLIHTVNLSDRKDVIVEESDILVALPGGIGTLDEVFHVMAASTIGYHHKKVIFYNVNGFYDTLLKALQQMAQAQFIRGLEKNEYYLVANSFNELINILKKPNLTDNND